MQVTLYFGEEDEYLIRLVDDKARHERKSRSAVVLSILEEYFEKDKKLGEILVDLGAITPQAVERALKRQQEINGARRIGELLVEDGSVPVDAIKRALMIQERVTKA